jgi:hypothetical protein
MRSLLYVRTKQETTRDKWLTLAAWKSLLYSHYDFGSGLDFNIQQLQKGLALFGPISEKVSAGNDSGIHSRYKHIGKDKHTTLNSETARQYLLESIKPGLLRAMQ